MVGATLAIMHVTRIIKESTTFKMVKEVIEMSWFS